MKEVERAAAREVKEIGRIAARDRRSWERAVARDLSFLRREIQEEKRVPIPSDTKKSVYERANGRCESCGRPLKMTGKGAQFHHTKKPTVKSRPSTIQFLCAFCHTSYGHEFYTVTKTDPLGTIKETRIKRKKVGKHKSPYWKEKPKTARLGIKKKTKKVVKKKSAQSKRLKRL